MVGFLFGRRVDEQPNGGPGVDLWMLVKLKASDRTCVARKLYYVQSLEPSHLEENRGERAEFLGGWAAARALSESQPIHVLWMRELHVEAKAAGGLQAKLEQATLEPSSALLKEILDSIFDEDGGDPRGGLGRGESGPEICRLPS